MAQIGALSNLRGSARGQAILARILAKSPWFQSMDSFGGGGWEEGATDNDFNTVEGETTLQTRGLDGNYASLSIVPGQKTPATQRFHGFQIDIDQAILADVARGLLVYDTWLDDRLAEEADTFAELYEKQVFQGTGAGSPVPLKGLLQMLNGVDDLPGYTGEKGVISAADYSLTPGAKSLDISVVDTDSANELLEAWEEWEAELEGDLIAWVPRKFAAKLGSAYRRLHGQADTVEMFGQKVRIIGNTKIIPILKDTIPLNEPNSDASANDTTSIVMASIGEKKLSKITNSGVDFEDHELLPDKQSGRIKLEIRSNWRARRKNVVRRIRHIKVG